MELGHDWGLGLGCLGLGGLCSRSWLYAAYYDILRDYFIPILVSPYRALMLNTFFSFAF